MAYTRAEEAIAGLTPEQFPCHTGRRNRTPLYG